jgi:thiamine biosynthesis protein ThiI
MGEDPRARLVLLRFSGDLSIKARATRHQFVRRLLHNLRDAISSQRVAPRVRLSHNRIFVELPEHADLAALTRVFGIQSLSTVEQRSGASLAEVVAAGEQLFRERVRGRRFAVRARRVGNRDRIPLDAREVERALGAALLPGSAGVDLGNPEVTAHVELLESGAYFFPERVAAEGGLPLGVEGRGVALLSGGFDSAVAAWQLLRRGVALDYVFCNLGGATHQLGVLRVAKVLADRWHYGHRPQLHTLDFGPLVENLQQHTARRYWQVLLKRLMLRAATRVAQERRAAAIVTGESVGQVSSQTLQNLAVISRATEHMILRPLVGTNKDEIIGVAGHIGTFELSKVVGEYCNLVPRKPATAASLEVVEAEERNADASLLERAIAGRSIVDLRTLDVDALHIPELEVTRVPPGATVIDLRPRRQFDAWHHPGSVRLDFAQALQAYPSFDRRKTYVLYCDFGLMSAHLAELMRRQGLEAFHVRGGTRELRRHSEAASH